MATVKLSEDEEERLALAWITKQQYEVGGYRKVLTALLGNAHGAYWAWSNALKFAVDLCSKQYHVSKVFIAEELK